MANRVNMATPAEKLLQQHAVTWNHEIVAHNGETKVKISDLSSRVSIFVNENATLLLEIDREGDYKLDSLLSLGKLKVVDGRNEQEKKVSTLSCRYLFVKEKKSLQYPNSIAVQADFIGKNTNGRDGIITLSNLFTIMHGSFACYSQAKREHKKDPTKKGIDFTKEFDINFASFHKNGITSDVMSGAAVDNVSSNLLVREGMDSTLNCDQISYKSVILEGNITRNRPDPIKVTSLFIPIEKSYPTSLVSQETTYYRQGGPHPIDVTISKYARSHNFDGVTNFLYTARDYNRLVQNNQQHSDWGIQLKNQFIRESSALIQAGYTKKEIESWFKEKGYNNREILLGLIEAETRSRSLSRRLSNSVLKIARMVSLSRSKSKLEAVQEEPEEQV